MLNRLQARIAKGSSEGGLTLIELLVVIIIIAILAAIAIPVFLAQREKGWKSQLESALKNSATAIESYATENNGSYAGASRADLDDEGLKVATDVNLTDADITTSADGNAFCIQATHDRLGALTMAVSSADSTPTEDGCANGVKN